jgi:hypothetical protein
LPAAREAASIRRAEEARALGLSTEKMQIQPHFLICRPTFSMARDDVTAIV